MDSISIPTVVWDEDICRRNINMMQRKARQQSVVFRPHFKTHRSLEVGRWFRDAGVHKITVSSLAMANQFIKDGWDDVTIAFPVNVREAGRINELASKIHLNILVDHPGQVEKLANEISNKTGVFIKVDTGYRRAGIAWDDEDGLLQLHEAIIKQQNLEFRGLLTHNGETYSANGKEEVEALHKRAVGRLHVASSLFTGAEISIGDTPSCSLSDYFEGVTEIRPGNFVFYDLMQWQIGSCKLQDIGMIVACPIISVYEKRKELLLYGGGIHLSKESIRIDGVGEVFGLAVKLIPKPGNGNKPPVTDYSWEFFETFSYIRHLSQEHAILEASDELMQSVGVGDLIGIMPVHSCLVTV